MNLTLRTLAGISLLLPVAFGCARTAPFDELDKAPMKILRIGPQPAPTPVTTAPAAGGLGSLIPGLSPDLQKMGEQAVQGLQQVLPPGILPPGLIPGQPTTAAPQQPQYQTWKTGLIILDQRDITDEDTREEVLDLFGDEDSFQAEHPQCFNPGIGISIGKGGAFPLQPGAVDLIISTSCSQAQGDGFQWPYKVNGFSTDANRKMVEIFQRFFAGAQPT